MSNLVTKTLQTCWETIEGYGEDMSVYPDTWTKSGLNSFFGVNDECIYDTIQKLFKKTSCEQVDYNRAAVNILWAFADDAFAPDKDTHFKDLKKFLKEATKEGFSWCGEVAIELSDFLKKEWIKQNLQEDEEKKPLAKQASAKNASVQTRVFARAKTVTKKMLVRKVSRKLVGNAHTALVKQLAGVEHTRQLAAYLDNPMGQALVSGLLALGLETLPLPESIKDAIDTIKDDLVEEMTIQAFDSATIPVENVMALLLPGIKDAIMPLLTAKDILQLKETND